MTRLADARVQTPDGRDVDLGDLVERPTILVLTRYYG